MLTFAESKHPVFRSTSPLSRGVLKSKGGGKLSIHFCADGDTIETVFRTIISVNQLIIYGAVSDLCEKYKVCHGRTGRLVVAGQSDPLFVSSVMKTHIPLTDDPAQEEDSLQRYQERIEKLSEQQRRTFLNMENVCVFDITSICFHEKGILRKFAFHQKYKKGSHNETDV